MANVSVSTVEPEVAPGRGCKLPSEEAVAPAPGSCSNVPEDAEAAPPDPDPEPAIMLLLLLKVAEEVAVANVVGRATSDPEAAADPGSVWRRALVDSSAVTALLVTPASRSAAVVEALAKTAEDVARGVSSDTSVAEAVDADTSAPTPMVWKPPILALVAAMDVVPITPDTEDVAIDSDVASVASSTADVSEAIEGATAEVETISVPASTPAPIV